MNSKYVKICEEINELTRQRNKEVMRIEILFNAFTFVVGVILGIVVTL